MFFEFNKRVYKDINSKNLKSFLNGINVNALLIGSSNQSDKTYFAQTSDKGEADIFMFSDKWFDNYGEGRSITVESVISNISNSFEDVAIAKSWQGKAHKNTNAFLKEILED